MIRLVRVRMVSMPARSPRPLASPAQAAGHPLERDARHRRSPSSGGASYGSPVEFAILGPLEVRTADGRLRLGGPMQRAVLAHLILRANLVVPAEQLVDELWGEEPPETARNTL